VSGAIDAGSVNAGSAGAGSTSSFPINSLPISAWRAAFLLTRLRLRRQFNQIGAAFGRYRVKSSSTKQSGSPTRWIVTALVAIAMLISFGNLAYQSVVNLENALGTVAVRNDGAANPRVAPRDNTGRPPARSSAQHLAPAQGSVLAPAVLRGATFATTLLLAAVLLTALAGREVARPEWDFEWLVTLPSPLSTLLASRLIERVVTNTTAFVALAPFLAVLAWTCGYRFLAPVLGVVLTLALLFVVATVQTLIDTGLRLSLPPPRLRNLHAVVTMASFPVIFLAFSMAMPNNTFIFGWASAMPDWAMWLPTGLAVQAIASADAASAAASVALMTAEIAAIVSIGFVLLRHQLRNGVVSVGAREAVARAPHRDGRAPSGVPAPAAVRAGRLAGGLAAPRAGLRALISPIQRRELMLLGRDRTFMVQTLVLPAMIVGIQLLANAGIGIFVGAVDQPSNLAAIAFGLAAYTLMFSAFQTLNAEGQALWILYCVPQSLESVLRQKARMWAVVAIIYPMALFAVAVAVAGHVTITFVGAVAVVVAGVPIFSAIATALGVFGCDPLAQEVQRRIRVTYLYLYMLLASFYAYAIYATTIWQRVALMILTALVAIALWQKARDRFDYLLDPSVLPPPRVSVSDGLIAALMFFVLQALAVLVQTFGVRAVTGQAVWIAFCGAGAVTYGIMRLIYWRAGTEGVPRVLDEGLASALLWGAIGGAVAALAGIAYLEVVWSADWFAALRRAGPLSGPAIPWWLAALAIVAAPVFEEFIFRGLIFGGLRRSLGPVAATLASAAIFAAAHPPASVLPVFVMGACAALIYERTRMLAAPMTVHAIYNATILGFQWVALH
jgi:ABC-2 type transport system permease protein